MENLPYLIAMIFSEIITVVLLLVILYSKKHKGQIQKAFIALISFMFIWTFCLILQITFQKSGIPPVHFEYYAAFGACFAPLAFCAIGYIFDKTKVTFRLYHLLFFIIPILDIILLFTNDYHHLFYEQYSIHITDTVFGPYFPIHSIYTYVILALGLFYLLRYSIKNSGFFSKQSLLIVVGMLLPIFVNILGLFGIPMVVYLMPISFTFTLLFFVLAIFKFKFLTITPIALQKIVDRISDGYLVLNEENVIIDFNQTFLNTFHLSGSKIRNLELSKVLQENSLFEIDTKTLQDILAKVKNSTKTFQYNQKVENINKYFIIEINNLTTDNEFIGTLILFKDTTQHMLDIQTIRNNQDMLMEKERLASLGQLIGGIAHNLKTPIMSISGASEGLNDLIKEYDISIDDPEVTKKDHHDIAKDMSSWVVKIKDYTEYMSDVITAVKGQAVTLSSDENMEFTIDELMKRIDILMKHELKNALINLNIHIEINSNTTIKGDVNSLVQVVNNMISNSIQSYNGKPNQDIDLSVCASHQDNLVISIRDYGVGMTEEVKHKLFKEMITTKGKNGTGLGLFMSYSTIKAHFGGNIDFTSEVGKGTCFNITLPLD